VLLLVLALLLLAAVLIGWGWQAQKAFSGQVLQPRAESVIIEPGDSFSRVLAKLRAAGIDNGRDQQWQLLARQLDAAGKLKVGEYDLTQPLTVSELLLRMRNGKVVQHRLTIVEGWNIRQLRAALARATPLEQTTTELDDAALMAALGFEGQHPEGRFLPETYVYQRGDSDLDVLRRAHKAMAQALEQAWQGRAEGLPLDSPYELLTLASIIEKETGLAAERPQIAGVFVRRLKLGMRLQTDPTVIYGLGSAYDGNIRKVDLTTDTPYNTYTRSGLTPSPIAMPGRAALEAAAHPAEGDALYFVAIGDGSGGHVFSATYAQHQVAVAGYLQRLRQARQSNALPQ
jgi:conserved hypothetical protein, YceG family